MQLILKQLCLIFLFVNLNQYFVNVPVSIISYNYSSICLVQSLQTASTRICNNNVVKHSESSKYILLRIPKDNG